MIDSESDSEKAVQRDIELERDPLALDDNDIVVKVEPLELYYEQDDEKLLNDSSTSLDHLNAEDVHKLKRLEWDRRYRERNRDQINRRRRENRKIKKILRESANDPLILDTNVKHDDITVDREYLEVHQDDIDQCEEEYKFSNVQQSLSEESLDEQLITCDNKVIKVRRRKNYEKECCDRNRDEVSRLRRENRQIMSSIEQCTSNVVTIVESAESREARRKMLHRERQRRYLARNRERVYQRKRENRKLLSYLKKSASVQSFDTDETSSTSVDINEKKSSKCTTLDWKKIKNKKITSERASKVNTVQENRAQYKKRIKTYRQLMAHMNTPM